MPYKMKSTQALAQICNGLTLMLLICAPDFPSHARQLTVGETVDITAKSLLSTAALFSSKYNKPLPQILFGIGGTAMYGSCVSSGNDNIIPGSFYCKKTNTIILEINELASLRDQFGDGAIAYALAHEFGHWIQAALDINSNGQSRELQADCIAGSTLSIISPAIQYDQSDLRESAAAAYSIGGSSHGSSEYRSLALLYGYSKGIGACLQWSNLGKEPNASNPAKPVGPNINRSYQSPVPPLPDHPSTLAP